MESCGKLGLGQPTSPHLIHKLSNKRAACFYSRLHATNMLTPLTLFMFLLWSHRGPHIRLPFLLSSICGPHALLTWHGDVHVSRMTRAFMCGWADREISIDSGSLSE
jgi:hypothetical protein